MKALFFGSIGTIVETSEIQRQSFNLAFKEAGLNWYWNIATYCDLLRAPGGKKRIRNYSKSVLNENIVDLIHSKKEEYFEKFLSENLSPREGVTEIIDLCTKSKIKLGFITTTSLKNINSIKTALVGTNDNPNYEISKSIGSIINNT